MCGPGKCWSTACDGAPDKIRSCARIWNTHIKPIVWCRSFLIARFSKWSSYTDPHSGESFLSSDKLTVDQHSESRRCTAQVILLIVTVCVLLALFTCLKSPADEKWQLKPLEVFSFWVVRKTSPRPSIRRNQSVSSKRCHMLRLLLEGCPSDFPGKAIELGTLANCLALVT